jgi:hypothetical protein
MSAHTQKEDRGCEARDQFLSAKTRRSKSTPSAGFTVTVNTTARAGHLMNIPVEIDESNADGTVDSQFRPVAP